MLIIKKKLAGTSKTKKKRGVNQQSTNSVETERINDNWLTTHQLMWGTCKKKDREGSVKREKLKHV